MTTELHRQLDKNIKALSEDEVINFATELCRQILPDYKVFQERHRWGNYSLLADTITKIANKELLFSDIKSLIDKIKKIIPDTEDFGDFDGSCALNTSACVLELLEYLIDNKKSHIFNISGYVTDTLDLKLQEKHPNITDKELENHPLLIDELNKQLRLTKNTLNTK